MPKRGRSPTVRSRTPRARRRSAPPTPPSTIARRVRSRSVSFAGTVARGAGRVAARALSLSRNPYVQGGMMAARYGRRIYSRLRAMTSRANVRRPRKGGAPDSKSSGFFSEFGPRRQSAMEEYIEKGVVYNSENGGVVNNTIGGTFKDVIYIGHSTMPKQRVLEVAFAALLKHLFKKAGIKVKNWSEAVLEGANIPARLELQYKDSDFTTISTFAATIPVTQTFQQTVAKFVDWYNAFTAITIPTVFLKLVYYHDIGTIGSSRLVAYEIDMTSTKCHFESVSYLKIQNRTKNQDGSKDSDDIDNVPIYGRHFMMNGNGSTFRDYNTPAANSAPQLRTDSFFGVLNYNLTTDIDNGSTMWLEVPMKNQITGVKSYGPAHLDPGQVKTSKLVFKKTISFPKLMAMIRTKATSAFTGGSVNAAPFYFGNTRIFAFEKMIKAVATDATNQMALAYEVNTDIGCYVQTYQNYQTAKQIQSSIGAQAP